MADINGGARSHAAAVLENNIRRELLTAAEAESAIAREYAAGALSTAEAGELLDQLKARGGSS